MLSKPGEENYNNNNLDDNEEFPIDSIYILHFNDCYNVESGESGSQEPVGGAARFAQALRQQFDQLGSNNTLVLFSGDILAPSIMSSFTKGEQMLPVLERCHVHCGLFGNHEFDFGLECLISFAKRCKFPWLMSNVIDRKTQRPLGEGKIKHIIQKGRIRIGLIGLIEEEWLSTLTLEEDEIEYLDFVVEGQKLAQELREKDNVDLVIALTHMRTHNDIKLANKVDEIDLILGGHDHVYDIQIINNKHIIKSGTDFRQFSKIHLKLNKNVNPNLNSNPNNKPKIPRIQQINVEEIQITSEIIPDPYLVIELEKFKTVLEAKMENLVAILDCDLDCRFSKVRTSETNSGNWITDVMLYAVADADFALLNSGTLRSDRIHPAGPFKMRDLVNILPYMESLLALEIDGYRVWQALENGVSQYPRFEGRFPQISGIEFQFDPRLPPGSRIQQDSIRIRGEPLDSKKIYKMVTKEFIAQGKDGYDMLKECKIYKNTEQCLTMLQAVQEFLEVTRIQQILEQKKSCDTSSSSSLSLSSNTKRALLRRNSLKLIQNKDFTDNLNLDDYPVCHLNPSIEGRIINLSLNIINGDVVDVVENNL